jgi:hypothetical protein
MTRHSFRSSVVHHWLAFNRLVLVFVNRRRLKDLRLQRALRAEM